MEKYKKYEPIFGSWYLVKLLGRGSFGNVYEIVREEYGVQYKAALKIISVPQDEDDIKVRLSVGSDRESISEYYEEILKDIVNENEIMSRLKGNSNIVSYEDHQIIPHEDGIGYDILIRMELLTPLLDRMLQGNLAESDVVKLGIDMCNALELCHKRNIIHRDIKPQNIFISEDGDYKLGDFGIARSIEKTTGGMSRKGTYNYMAPEVFKGEEYDVRVDIYSLGMVLYSLLNGNRGSFLPPAPTKITPQMEDDARNRRLKGEPVPAPAEATPMLAHIILKACAYDPGNRYENASQMKRDLELYYTNHSNAAEAMSFILQGEKTEVDFFKDYSSANEASMDRPNPIPVYTTSKGAVSHPRSNNKNISIVLITVGLALILLVTGGAIWNYIHNNKTASNVAEEETSTEVEDNETETETDVEEPVVLSIEEGVIGSWQSENGFGSHFIIEKGGVGTTDFYNPIKQDDGSYKPVASKQVEDITWEIKGDDTIEINSEKAHIGKTIFLYDPKEGVLWLDASENSSKYIKEDKAVNNGDNGNADSVFQVGKEYVVTDEEGLFIRDGATTKANKKNISDLSKDGKKRAIEGKGENKGKALLKKGTDFTCLQTKVESGDGVDREWVRIPSGWICGREGLKAYIKEK